MLGIINGGGYLEVRCRTYYVGSILMDTFSHQVDHIDYKHAGRGLLIVVLAPNSTKPSPDDVKQIKKVLKFVKTVIIDPDHNLSISVILKPLPGGADPLPQLEYMNLRRRRRLIGFFNPRTVRSANVSVNVLRRNGVHVGTEIIITRVDGILFYEDECLRSLTSESGVSRVLIRGGHVILTMSEPAIDDSNGKITELIRCVGRMTRTRFMGRPYIRDDGSHRTGST